MTTARETLEFFKKLTANNNREWFNQNKQLYSDVYNKMNLEVNSIIESVRKFDELPPFMTAKDCTYRIYTDMRFSQDRLPYKTHYGMYITNEGKKSERAGYYLHLQPGDKSMIAGGMYITKGKLMKMIRNEIIFESEKFMQIVNNPNFKGNFFFTNEKLKRMPLGLPSEAKSSDIAEFLMLKDFTVCKMLNDDFFDDVNWKSKITELFKTIKPYNDFMNNIYEEYKADEQ